MRTTVRLEPELMDEVRRFASQERTSVTAVLSRALRELLARGKALPGRERVPLATFGGRGLQTGVDLDDTSALLDLMEAADGPP